MGLIYTGICTNCGCEKDYTLNDNTDIFKEKLSCREKLVERLDDKNKSRLEQLASKDKLLKEYIFENIENGFQLEFSYQVYRCENCNYFENRPLMRIKYKGKKVFETKYTCKNCGKEMRVDKKAFMKSGIAYNICPDCHTKGYEVKPKDIWE